jgi:hypothetical protein
MPRPSIYDPTIEAHALVMVKALGLSYTETARALASHYRVDVVHKSTIMRAIKRFTDMYPNEEAALEAAIKRIERSK